MIKPKFENYQDYLLWCERIVTKIYYANIAMSNENIKNAIDEIAGKLHVVEGQELWGDGNE